MRIGVPKEIKNREYRVGLTPAAVRELTSRGHDVFVERLAGDTIGLTDEMYERAGARLLGDPAEIFATADMIVKVKEPQPVEIKRLRPGQTLFTYLHLAPDPAQTKGLIESGAIAIAYETVTDARGGLPLVAAMSEVAGRMSIQAGAHSLEIAQGGRGMLLGGVAGVAPAKVVVLGGGVAGINAARMAIGVEYLKGERLYAAHARPSGSPGEKRQAYARREVILAGGAFNTPQLLMLSGVGPADVLATHRIPVVSELPRVGKNLQDRYEVAVVNRMKNPWDMLQGATFTTRDAQYREWDTRRKGVYTTNGALLCVIARSTPGQPAPDLFCYFAGTSPVTPRACRRTRTA